MSSVHSDVKNEGFDFIEWGPVNSDVKTEGFDFNPVPLKLTFNEKKLNARGYIGDSKVASGGESFPEKKAKNTLEYLEYGSLDLKVIDDPSEDCPIRKICFVDSVAVDDISIQSTEYDLLPKSDGKVINTATSRHVVDEQTISEVITKVEDSPEDMESEEDKAEQLTSGKDRFEKGLLVSDLISENVAAKSNVNSEEFTFPYEHPKPIRRSLRVLSHPKIENLEKLTWYLVAKTKAAITFEEIQDQINSSALWRLYGDFQRDRTMDLVSLDAMKTTIEDDFREFEERKESSGHVFTKINDVLFSDADTVEGLKVINKHLRTLADDCHSTMEYLTFTVDDVITDSKRYMNLSETVEKNETKFERFKIPDFLKEM